MYTLSCAQIGTTDCNFSTHGNTPDEVKKAIMDHAMKAHSDKMKNMSDADKKAMMAKMDSMMQQV